MERYYVVRNSRAIDETTYRKSSSGGTTEMSWSFRSPAAERAAEPSQLGLSVKLVIGENGVFLELPNYDRSNHQTIIEYSRVTDDIQTLAWTYFQNAKLSSLYFVIGGDGDRHTEFPREQSSAARRILRKIFSGNTTNVFLSFMLLSFVLFFIIGFYTVFMLIILQFVALVFADRIALNLGNVHPTVERPFVTIVSVRSTPEKLKSISGKGREILSGIRTELSQTLASTPSPPSWSASPDAKSRILQVLAAHGIESSPNDIEIKTKNVYAIVQKVASSFRQLAPKIVISNSIVSNAAATGISKSHSSVTITAGSLEDLNDDELEAVIGHEFGHLKGRDPLILFAVTSFEFLGRFFLWYPLLLYLGIFYFVLAFGAIFLVGKFLETRADTESAVMLRLPLALSSGLAKIGFRQLYREKYAMGAKLIDWFQFDPHPPIYFRIARIVKIEGRENSVRHTLLTSIRDCFVYFFRALVSM